MIQPQSVEQPNNIVKPQAIPVQQPIQPQPINQPVTQQPVQQPKIPKKSNTGLIIGIVAGSICAIIAMVITIILIGKSSNKVANNIDSYTNTFYGNGFSLKYDSSWSKTSLTNTNGESADALMYGYEGAYLLPIGQSSLSEFESQYNLDFDTNDGKDKLYSEFYSYWNTNLNGTSLYGGSDGFSILVDDIYYATMDYGTSSSNITGRMYLVISPENNSILSFMSNMSKNFESNSEKVLEILKTIEINSVYDDEMAGILNSMSAWNMYSDVREGTLGTKKDINGSWRVLSDSESYWVFKNGEYWWYKSYNDLNDNYWYGKTKILTGKEGLKEVGLDEDKVDMIKANTSGSVTENNIYTIIFTPSKIISGGVDKSSTNISGEDWKMVWIIVDHGTEGLEAQVLNMGTYDTSYYVKVSD